MGLECLCVFQHEMFHGSVWDVKHLWLVEDYDPHSNFVCIYCSEKGIRDSVILFSFLPNLYIYCLVSTNTESLSNTSGVGKSSGKNKSC